MIINSSLYIPLYEFVCEKKLTDLVYDEVIKLNFIKVPHNSNSEFSQGYTNTKLIDWFQLCVDEVKDIYFKKNIELKITSCWVNRCKNFSNIQTHWHVNSIISGVFYLNPDSNLGTKFFLPNPWLESSKLISAERDINLVNTFAETSGDYGKLILFPSSLYHSTRPHKLRYSLSFNTFFKGIVDDSNISKILTL